MHSDIRIYISKVHRKLHFRIGEPLADIVHYRKTSIKRRVLNNRQISNKCRDFEA